MHGNGWRWHSAQLRLGVCRGSARLRAAPACCGGFLALARRLLRALLAAELASRGAQRAQLDGELAAPRQVTGRQPAYLRALHVALDASNGLCRARLFQTGGRAAMACSDGVITAVDAGTEVFFIHIHLLDRGGRCGVPVIVVCASLNAMTNKFLVAASNLQQALSDLK